MLALASRTARTGSPEGSSPCRYRVSPAGLAGAAAPGPARPSKLRGGPPPPGGLAGAAPGGPASSSSFSAAHARRAGLGAAVGVKRRPWRTIVLAGGQQATVGVHQLIRRDKPLDPQPRLARGPTHQRHRSMVHFLAPVHLEG